MKTNQQNPEWKDLKAKIQNQFGKLSDEDLEGLKGNMDKLSSKVQEAYGYDKKRADQESRDFNETLKKIS